MGLLRLDRLLLLSLDARLLLRCLDRRELFLVLVRLNRFSDLIIFEILLVQILIGLWEVTALQRLQSLIVGLGRRVIITITELIPKGVQVGVVRWIHNLAEVSLATDFLGLRVRVAFRVRVLAAVLGQLVETVVGSCVAEYLVVGEVLT